MYDKIHSSVCDTTPSCLDSAMERKAIEQGFVFDLEDLFPENKEYYETKRDGKLEEEPVKEYSYNSNTKEYEPYVSKKK